MGEDVFAIKVEGFDEKGWREVRIQFSEMDEGGCLCTFPHNDNGELSRERVKSLALLGAAVALAHQGEFEDYDYNFIPDCVPQWILDGIEEALK